MSMRRDQIFIDNHGNLACRIPGGLNAISLKSTMRSVMKHLVKLDKEYKYVKMQAQQR